MTRLEYLLVCAAEECSEVAQAITKALRFGLNDINPKLGVTAQERIEAEINDLYATLESLQMYGIDTVPNADLMEKKREKIQRYIRYSYERGSGGDF